MPDPSIHILPDYLANQIAAGEVVQRPESVVKELVENALDSGATAVSVIVRGAGKQVVHVIDNGRGMSAEDLALCLVRHATSKISTEADLHAIQTLGFRGEALASIAAVADVEIRSRLRDSTSANQSETVTIGNKLISRPGHRPEIVPDNCSEGTQILVRNLFYNIPARRKFLKSDLTEFRHISETMQRMALSRPDVRFTFYDGEALVFDVDRSTLEQRTADILGVSDGKRLLPVQFSDSGLTITGYVGVPTLARQSRSGQYLFLNNRPIVSRALTHAAVSAYEHLLESGQMPVFVLHLNVDPKRVDVNVHPQKHEVKFEDERLAYLHLQGAVSAALRTANVIPAVFTDAPLATQPLQSLHTSEGTPASFVNRLTGEIHAIRPTISQTENSRLSGRWSAPASMGKSDYYNSQKVKHADSLSFLEGEEVKQVLHAGMQFIVTTLPDGLAILDQHAAHERILYEKALHTTTATARSEQALLFSVKLSLAPSDIVVIREYSQQLEQLGFRFDILSGTELEIHAVPADVQPGSEEYILAHMIESLRPMGSLPRERRTEGIAAIYARSQAIKRGVRLTTEEMRTLVRELFACKVPHLTADGRPTYFILSFDELGSRLR